MIERSPQCRDLSEHVLLYSSISAMTSTAVQATWPIHEDED